MGLIIESGTGNGFQAGVEEDNRLLVLSTDHSQSAHAAEKGDCYYWSTSYDYSAADTVLWITNTSTTRTLIIEKVHISSDTTTLWTMHSPAYVAPAGTVITGINSNRTSGKSADTLCYQNETNNTQANILLKGITLANAYVVLPIDGKIVLGYHNCLAVDFTTAGTLATASFVAHYD